MSIKIPPLISGGIMLSYKCTNTCKHCLYNCSPKQPNEWLSLEMAEKVFDALAGEPYLHSIHIAGGEPGLNTGLLENTIELAVKKGIPISYMETNAIWCKNYEETREKMFNLRGAGLSAILISVSIFHNEFVPFRNTKICVETAYEVFGEYNTLIYLPHMYKLLSEMPDDGTHSLDEFCKFFGIARNSPDIPGYYQIIPGGRAPKALKDCYKSYPAKKFKGQNCKSELLSTSHFHIDNYGNLFTGLCAGIAPGTVDNLHPVITEVNYPVFHELSKNGPYGLMKKFSLVF